MGFPVRCPPGKAQFVVTLNPGVAKKQISLAGLDTQTDPLTFWPDKSFRQALVTANVSTAGTYDLVMDGEPPTLGPMPTPTWPAASVEFVIAGKSFTATLPPWFDGERVVSGPLCIERDIVVVPVDSAGKEHPYLQVFFDVCCFRDGACLLDINVHNGRDALGRMAIAYTATVTVNGSRVFGPQAETHYSWAVWSVSAGTGGYVASRVDPDPEMYYAAGIFPRFLGNVANQTAYNPTGPSWGPLQFGDLQYSMGTPGGRPELGPVTAVTAQYLSYRGKEQRDQILAHGTLAGSWCGHAMEADGVTPVMLSNHPSDYGGPQTKSGIGGYMELNGPHLPSLTVLPYLLTGRRRYLRSLQAWACTVIWQLYNLPCNTSQRIADTNIEFSRQGAKGIMAPNYASEPRGYGWCMRTVADAATCTPDVQADLKTYLTGVVVNNLGWLDDYAAQPGGGAFNVPFHEFDNGTGGTGSVHVGYTSTSLWQMSYLCYGIDHCIRLGFPTTKAFFARACNTLVLLFSASAATKDQDWPRVGSSYYPRFGTVVVTANGSVSHRTFTSWPEYFNANYMMAGDDKDIAAPPFPRAAGPNVYAPEYRMTLVYAERMGLPGATEALNWVETNWGGIGEALGRAGYAIARTSLAGVPIVLPPVVTPPVVVPPVVTPPVTAARVLECKLTARQNEPNADPSTLAYTFRIPVKAVAPPPAPPVQPAALKPQVRISALEIKEPVTAGEPFPIRVFANNAGAGQATGAVEKLGLHPDVVVLSAPPEYNIAADEWSVGTLDANTIEVLDIIAKVKVQP